MGFGAHDNPNRIVHTCASILVAFVRNLLIGVVPNKQMWADPTQRIENEGKKSKVAHNKLFLHAKDKQGRNLTTPRSPGGQGRALARG